MKRMDAERLIKISREEDLQDDQLMKAAVPAESYVIHLSSSS